MAIEGAFPSLDPQHPQHAGKYEMKLGSDPQQSRNTAATEAQHTDVKTLKREDVGKRISRWLQVAGRSATGRYPRSGKL
jgi:hypothetical protein